MAVRDDLSPSKLTHQASRIRDYPAGGIGFDSRFLLLCLWLVVGLYLDGWAHNHIGADLDPFFTPWHAVMYSGFAAVALYLGWTHWRNQSRGHVWGRTVPGGYNLSLAGVVVFGLGGFGDFLWHMTFGLERGAEIFLSPTHHLLVVGMAMIVLGPFRAAWRRRENPARAGEWLVMIGSATLCLSVITLISQAMHLFISPYPLFRRSDEIQLLSVTSAVIQSMLLSGFMLMIIRRWRGLLPIWGFPLLIISNALGHTSQTDLFLLLPASFITAIVAGGIYWRIRPALNANQPGAHFGLRLFAGIVPVVLYGLYFLTWTIVAPGEINWRIHSITGIISVAGFAGWLLSYAMFPAPLPEENKPKI